MATEVSAEAGWTEFRDELARAGDALREARLAEFPALAASIENRLAALREQPPDAASALELRRELPRIAGLLEVVSAYKRARLALAQPVGEAYGPNGSPRSQARVGRRERA